jgi:hypothetical protein
LEASAGYDPTKTKLDAVISDPSFCFYLAAIDYLGIDGEEQASSQRNPKYGQVRRAQHAARR